MKTFLTSARFLAVLTLLLGGLYPALVWAIGQAAFPAAANGSLTLHPTSGRIVGSALLAQATPDPRYVQPRPSAADYATVASGASSLPWTSTKLHDRVKATIAAGQSPSMATTSGSGLDPHLPPAAVLAQLDHVATARSWTPAARTRAEAWVAEHLEGGQLGPTYVNVLRLNLALDALDKP
ncbi:MAG: potassium-transporting ATPase subunit C [Verrucomicrobia bacterium]|nr:potassium-transporting ATPase subunit C [Verrucomicrobiota bacterium]